MGYGNFRATKLSNDIDAVTASIKIDTLPRDSTNAIITSGRLVIEPRNTDKREIIKFTGVDIPTTTLTGVLRGRGGTSATTHSKGASVEMNVTAEDLEEALGVPNQLATYFSEAGGNFIVKNTGVVTQASGLIGAFSNIVYYITGFRYSKNSIPNKTYTINKDTYVFIDIAGVVTYTEVNNNAAAPATPANNILVAVVSTNASTITAIALRSRGFIKNGGIDYDTLIGWELVGVAEMTVAGTTVLNIDIPKEKRGKAYKILAQFERATAGGGVSYPRVQVNGDTGSTYQTRAMILNSAASAVIIQNSTITNIGEVELAAAQGAGGLIEATIVRSLANGWWPFNMQCASDTYIKNGGGRWKSSAEITSFQFNPTGVNCVAGTKLLVYSQR